MSKCRNCGLELIPAKEYILNGRVICEDCCVEERIPYTRKPAWQYIRSIKSEYLIPARQSIQDHRAYRKYMQDHPEEFEDQPPLGMCGTLWFEAIRKGERTADDMRRASNGMKKRWKDYHLTKAKSLGFEIDIKKFKTTGYDNFSSIKREGLAIADHLG